MRQAIMCGMPLGLGLAMLVTSCDPIYCSRYQYTQPSSQPGKQCAKQCRKQKRACLKDCPEQYVQCRKHARRKALNQYRHYAHQKTQNRESLTKDANDFIEANSVTSECEQYCHCHWYFARCYNDCGGNAKGINCSLDYLKVLKQRGYQIPDR